MPRKVVRCPICKEQIEVVGLHWHSGYHWCTQAGTGLYTNGILFSTDFREITVVPRTRKAPRTPSQDRQVPGEVIQTQCESWLQNKPSPAWASKASPWNRSTGGAMWAKIKFRLSSLSVSYTGSILSFKTSASSTRRSLIVSLSWNARGSSWTAKSARNASECPHKVQPPEQWCLGGLYIIRLWQIAK